MRVCACVRARVRVCACLCVRARVPVRASAWTCVACGEVSAHAAACVRRRALTLPHLVPPPRYYAHQIFGIMGKHKRCKLPVCVLEAVRRAHPNPAGTAYQGFVHTLAEWEEPENLEVTPSDYEENDSEYASASTSSTSEDTSDTERE